MTPASDEYGILEEMEKKLGVERNEAFEHAWGRWYQLSEIVSRLAALKQAPSDPVI